MNFRKDINGIRAIAVIAVLLFHFNSSWLQGGFAGVDVFFVISGFLMTGIIFRGIEQENFSILKFYVARANRIIPALAVLCLVLLIFGWFYLTPLDYKALGKHVASSMGFLSNIIYWRESGYFDTSSQEKWLLHTWSLSAEWQFYIIYPLILVVMRKFMTVKKMKKAVLFGTILGFLFCVVATYKWPNAAYYLLPTRAWEMMVGGVAFLYPFSIEDKRKKLVEWLGLTLIFISYFLISESNPWPGYLAILPVFGAFLIIQSQRNDSFITSNIVFQKIGTWSYSIYLWHWPIVVAIYYFSLNDSFIYIGIVLSILLGFLSNKYIEKIKFRNDFSGLRSYLKCKPMCFMLIAGLFSSLIYSTNGMNKNTYSLSGYIEKTKHTSYCHSGPTSNLDCRLGSKKSEPIGLVWGDSYAGQLDPFVINFLSEEQSFVSRTTSYCVPSLSLTKSLGWYPEYCRILREKTIEEIKNKKYKVIFLAGRWEYLYDNDSEAGFNSVLDAINLSSNNALVVYVVAQPILYKRNIRNDFLRSKISSRYKVDYTKDDNLANEINNKLEQAIKKIGYKNVYYISRDVIYGSSTHSDLTSSGIPYTFDQGHFTDAGSLAASKNFINSKLFNLTEKILNH